MLAATVPATERLALLVVVPEAWWGAVAALDLARERPVLFVEALTPAELEAAISQPARLVNLACDLSLQRELSQAGAELAQLSFTLQALWQERQDGLLSYRAYQAMGGLAGAINYRAERCYNALSQSQRRQVPALFRHLVDLSDSGQAQSRFVSWETLAGSAETEPVRRLLAPFVAEGLLVVRPEDSSQADQVGLATFGLVEQWPRLTAWLDEEWEFRLWRRRFQSLLAGQQPLKLRGFGLREAGHWLARRQPVLSASEQHFIRQGLARQGQLWLGQRALKLGLLALLLAIVAITLFWQTRTVTLIAGQRDVARTAVVKANVVRQVSEAKQATAEAQREHSEQQQRILMARQLAWQAESLLDDPDHGLLAGTLLAAESLRRSPSPAGDLALRRGLAHLPRAKAIFSHDGEVWQGVFSPDGQWLVTRSENLARIWNTTTGRLVAKLSHRGPVSAVAFSPDSRWLATASMAQLVQVWEVANGREIGQLRHNDRVWEVSFSPDGQWLISRSDRAIFNWRLADNPVGQLLLTRRVDRATNPGLARVVRQLNKGEPRREPRQAIIGPGVTTIVSAVTILAMDLSPDGRWLATAGVDQTARIWQVESGREVARLPHQGVVRAVAFSPDGRLLASGSGDKLVRLWSLTDLAQTGIVSEVARSAHPAGVNIVKFSPNGQWLVSGAVDHTARVWLLILDSHQAINDVRQVAEFKHEDRLQALTFNSDGRWLATASADHTVAIWWSSTGQLVTRLNHQTRVNDVTFSPDDRWLATSSMDQTARLWEMTIGYEMSQMIHDNWVLGLTFSPDGRRLATIDGPVAHVWETASGAALARLPQARQITALAFSPDGQWLATGSNHEANVWEIDSGRSVLHDTFGGVIRRVEFSPATSPHQLLAAAGVSRIASIWDVSSRRLLAELPHQDWVNAIAFSSDGRWLATASQDNTARIWESVTGREIIRLEQARPVNDVAFSPDGRWLATAGADRTTRLWQAPTVNEVARLDHDSGVLGLTFSPDGQRLATWDSSAVQTWQIPGGKMASRWENQQPVTKVIFSPDSKLTATTSSDRLVRLWDTASGRPLATLQHEYWVNVVDFSPDGRWLATAGADQHARIWLLEPADLLAEACLRLTRNLTYLEWRTYVGPEPYRVTCANLPDAPAPEMERSYE